MCNKIYFDNLLKWLENVELTDFHKCAFVFFLCLSRESKNITPKRVQMHETWRSPLFGICVYVLVSFLNNISFFTKISNKFQLHNWDWPNGPCRFAFFFVSICVCETIFFLYRSHLKEEKVIFTHVASLLCSGPTRSSSFDNNVKMFEVHLS